MLFISEMLSNHRMKSISEIRLENLETLVKEAGTAETLAERSGLSPVYLSQIRSRAVDAKTGKARNLGSVAARKLEAGMGKAHGWMDKDHSLKPDGPGPAWPFRQISPDDYGRLTDPQKDAIEDWVAQQVRSFLAPAQLKSGGQKKVTA